MDGRWVWPIPAQQPERFDLFCSSLGIGVDLLDAGGGAENHGNAAGTGVRSYGSGGSGCAGNGHESGYRRIGQDYDDLSGNVFVPELDSGLVQSRGRSQGIQEFLE